MVLNGHFALKFCAVSAYNGVALWLSQNPVTKICTKNECTVVGQKKYTINCTGDIHVCVTGLVLYTEEASNQ